MVGTQIHSPRRRAGAVAALLQFVVLLGVAAMANAADSPASPGASDASASAASTAQPLVVPCLTLVAQDRDARSEGKARTIRIRLTDEAVRLERLRGAPGPILYHHGSDSLVILNEDEKTYFKINASDLQQLTGKLDEAKEAVDQGLEGLDQIKELNGGDADAIKGLIRKGLGKLEGQASTPPTAKLLRTDEKAAGYDCELWEISRDGERIAHVWLAPAAALEASPEQAAVLAGLTQFAEIPLLAAVGVRSPLPGPPPESVTERPRILVRRLNFKGGKPDREWILTEVKKDGASLEAFNLPEGYSPMKLPVLK